MTALAPVAAALAPALFAAVTLIVYAVPSASPVSTACRASPDAVTVIAPGLAVTVYRLIGAPPLRAGAVQATVAL
jgi:hypothetical protein